MNFFIKAITPGDTEEVKPGLFIQKRGKESYRHIYPGAWDGKIMWKNFLVGGQPIRRFVFFLILMFIVFSYTQDVSTYKGFYETVQGDPFAYCEALRESQIVPECTKELQVLGLCTILQPDGGFTFDFDFSNENTNTLPSNN